MNSNSRTLFVLHLPANALLLWLGYQWLGMSEGTFGEVLRSIVVALALAVFAAGSALAQGRGGGGGYHGGGGGHPGGGYYGGGGHYGGGHYGGWGHYHGGCCYNPYWGVGVGIGIGFAASGYWGWPYYGYYGWPYYYGPAYSYDYAVPANPGYTVSSAPAPAPAAPAAAPEPIYYPRNGQSDAQKETDLRECNRWATTQPPAMADAAVFQRAVLACMDGRGYTAH